MLNIRIQKHRGCHIFNFCDEELLNRDMKELDICLKKDSKARLALDLRHVKKIDDEIFDFINKNKLAICAINIDMLTYFSLRNAINNIPIYANINDFIENKRRLIKRRFQVV